MKRVAAPSKEEVTSFWVALSSEEKICLQIYTDDIVECIKETYDELNLSDSLARKLGMSALCSQAKAKMNSGFVFNFFRAKLFGATNLRTQLLVMCDDILLADNYSESIFTVCPDFLDPPIKNGHPIRGPMKEMKWIELLKISPVNWATFERSLALLLEQKLWGECLERKKTKANVRSALPVKENSKKKKSKRARKSSSQCPKPAIGRKSTTDEENIGKCIAQELIATKTGASDSEPQELIPGKLSKSGDSDSEPQELIPGKLSKSGDSDSEHRDENISADGSAAHGQLYSVDTKQCTSHESNSAKPAVLGLGREGLGLDCAEACVDSPIAVDDFGPYCSLDKNDSHDDKELSAKNSPHEHDRWVDDNLSWQTEWTEVGHKRKQSKRKEKLVLDGQHSGQSRQLDGQWKQLQAKSCTREGTCGRVTPCTREYQPESTTIGPLSKQTEERCQEALTLPHEEDSSAPAVDIEVDAQSSLMKKSCHGNETQEMQEPHDTSDLHKLDCAGNGAHVSMESRGADAVGSQDDHPACQLQDDQFAALQPEVLPAEVVVENSFTSGIYDLSGKRRQSWWEITEEEEEEERLAALVCNSLSTDNPSPNLAANGPSPNLAADNPSPNLAANGPMQSELTCADNYTIPVMGEQDPIPECSSQVEYEKRFEQPYVRAANSRLGYSTEEEGASECSACGHTKQHNATRNSDQWWTRKPQNWGGPWHLTWGMWGRSLHGRRFQKFVDKRMRGVGNAPRSQERLKPQGVKPPMPFRNQPTLSVDTRTYHDSSSKLTSAPSPCHSKKSHSTVSTTLPGHTSASCVSEISRRNSSETPTSKKSEVEPVDELQILNEEVQPPVPRAWQTRSVPLLIGAAIVEDEPCYAPSNPNPKHPAPCIDFSPPVCTKYEETSVVKAAIVALTYEYDFPPLGDGATKRCARYPKQSEHASSSDSVKW